MTVLTKGPVSTSEAALPPGVRSTSWTEIRTVVVRGALDVSTLARVSEQLDEAMAARPSRLVVDLSDCSFVDASALAVLLEAHRRTSRSGAVLTLCGCSPRVLRLLSLTGLRRVFDLA
jgi:anti-anti-sigma factor